MDQRFKTALYDYELRAAEAALSEEGSLMQRLSEDWKQNPAPPMDESLPGSVLMSSLLKVNIAEASLAALQDTALAHGETLGMGAPPKLEVTDELVSQAKGLVEQRLGVSLSRVEVVCIPLDRWGNDGSLAQPEPFVMPRGDQAPLVLMPQFMPQPMVRLAEMLARAAHIMLRREDGDPAKLLADATSETLVAFAAILPLHVKLWGEGALAYSLFPILAGMYAMGMLRFAVIQGEPPASVSELSASPMGEVRQGGQIRQELLEHCHRTFKDDPELTLLEVKQMGGLLLALAFCDYPEHLVAFMRSDSLALSMEEKILHAFQEDAEEHLGLAEALLDNRLKLARVGKTDPGIAMIH